MFRRYWHIGFAVGLASLSICGSVHCKPSGKVAIQQSSSSAKSSAAPSVVAHVQGSQGGSKANERPKTGKNSEFDLDVRGVEAAEKSAKYTLWTVWVGIAGTIAVVVALAVSIWQNVLTRNAYIADHRPRVKIEQLQSVSINRNEPAKFTLYAYNVGESDAIIDRIEIRTSCRKCNIHVEFDKDVRYFKNEILKTGEMLCMERIYTKRNISPFLEYEIFSNLVKFYIEIVIHYSAMVKISKATGVMMVFNVESGRLEPTNENDLSHLTFEH
jgi:hypothetical protein